MFEFLEEKRKKKNANQVRTAGIIHQFHYDFGKAGEQESYTLTQEGNTVEMIVQKIGSDVPEKRGAVDRSAFNILYRVIMEQKIYLWNGFHKNNSMAVNGYTFSLNVKFENWTLSASGCAMRPAGYDAAHRVLCDCLREIALSL